MNEEKRLNMLKMINMCEIRGKLLDTRLIDHVLSFFSRRDTYVCSASTPLMGKMAPYYKIQLEKLPEKLSSDVNLILLPLCDRSHFHGFAIDRKEKVITHIDSLYKRTTGRRSVSASLVETFFPGDDSVKFQSFYPKRIQTDGHSCGAWMVMGLIATLLGILTVKPSFTRVMAFSLLMILIENIPDHEKHNKAVDLYDNDKDMIKNFPSESHNNDNEDHGGDDSDTLDLLFNENPLHLSTPSKTTKVKPKSIVNSNLDHTNLDVTMDSSKSSK